MDARKNGAVQTDEKQTNRFLDADAVVSKKGCVKFVNPNVSLWVTIDFMSISW